MLEISTIKRFFYLFLSLSISLSAAEIELLGTRVFITGEGDIEFELKLALSEGDTLEQGANYFVSLSQTGIFEFSAVASLDIGSLSSQNPTQFSFQPSMSINGPSVIDTLSITATTIGLGGMSTAVQLSGTNIESGVSPTGLELHTLGVSISPERMVVGQTDYDAVDITLTDEDGVGIFTQDRSFTFGITDGVQYDLSSASSSHAEFDRTNSTYTLTSDLSSSGSITLSGGSVGDTYEIRPAVAQGRGDGDWQVSTSNLTLTSDSTVSVGTPSLNLESESALIIGSNGVDVSLLLEDDATYPSLEQGDNISIILPASTWQWNDGNTTAGFTMGTGSSRTMTPVIGNVGDTVHRDKILSMEIAGVSLTTPVTLSSGNLGFSTSVERMVVGQTLHDSVLVSLNDEDEVGIFTEGRAFSLYSANSEVELNFRNEVEGAPSVSETGISFDASSHVISIDDDLSDVFELTVSSDDNPSIQIIPSSGETGGSSTWTLISVQTGISSWDDGTSTTAVSAGTPTLMNTGELVLICDDTLVGLSFSMSDDAVNSALESGDKVELVTPALVNWNWSSTGDNSSVSTFTSGPVAYGDSIISVGSTYRESVELFLELNDDTDNLIETGVILSAGHLIFDISPERMVVGQQTSDLFNLTLRDSNEVGLFTGGRTFKLRAFDLTTELQFQEYTPLGVTFDEITGVMVVNEGLNPTAPLFISSQDLAVRPSDTQTEVSTRWALELSGAGVKIGSEISVGYPNLSVLSNQVLLCENSEQQIIVELSFGGEFQALDGTETDLKLDLGNSGLVWRDVANPRITLSNLSEDARILEIDATAAVTALDSVPIQIQVSGTTVHTEAFLKAGRFGVEISEERLIVGQETDTLDLIFRDIDFQGIFDGDSTLYFIVMPENLGFQLPPGSEEINISNDTLYFNNDEPETSDLLFNVLVFDQGIPITPSQLSFGFFANNGAEHIVGQTTQMMQVGDIDIAFILEGAANNGVLISGNPEVINSTFTVSQNGSIQNFAINDELKLRVPESLDVKWSEWGLNGSGQKPDWLQTPIYTPDSAVVSFQVIDIPPLVSESPNFTVSVGIRSVRGENIAGDEIQLSCRTGSWHDSTTSRIQIEAMQINMPDMIRLWNLQSGGETLNFGINHDIRIDSLNRVNRPFFIAMEGMYAPNYLTYEGSSAVLSNIDDLGKRFIKITGLEESTDLANLISLNPLPAEILSPRRIELYAFDPQAFPNHPPNAITISTVQIGSPTFNNTDTTDIFIVNNSPHTSLLNLGMEESSEARAIDVVDGIQIVLPPTLGVVDSAYIGIQEDERFISGFTPNDTIIFDISAEDTSLLSSWNFHLYLSGLDHESDEIDSLSMSFDGGVTWVQQQTPKIYLDVIEFAVLGESQPQRASRRFTVGSDVTASLPSFILRDVDRLHAGQDSIDLQLTDISWESTGTTHKRIAVTPDSILVVGSGQIISAVEGEKFVDVSLHTSGSADYSWSIDSIITIGNPSVRFDSESTGRLAFPLDADISAYNHSWKIPDILLSDTSEARAWRPNSTLRISTGQNPLSFALETPQIIPSMDSVSIGIEDSVIYIHFGNIDPPEELRLRGIEAVAFNDTTTNASLSVSFDGYDEVADQYGYTHLTSDDIKISNPDFSFRSYAWTDQVLVPGFRMDLDSCMFIEAEQPNLLLQPGDTLKLTIGNFFEENFSWEDLAGNRIFPNLSTLNQTPGEFPTVLWLNGNRIRESLKKIIVTDAKLFSSDSNSHNGFHLYYEQLFGIAEAQQAVLPVITVHQPNFQGLISDNTTFYLKLPVTESIKWSVEQDLDDWNTSILASDSSVLSLTVIDTTTLDRNMDIRGLQVDIGDSSTEPEWLRFSLLPPRRTQDDLLFHLVDTTAQIAVFDLDAYIVAGETSIDTSIFVVSDPQVDTLEILFSHDTNLDTVQLFNQPGELWIVETDSDGLNMDPINLQDVVNKRYRTRSDVLNQAGYSNAFLNIPSPYQGNHRLKVDWTYAVSKPRIHSEEDQFVTIDNSGDYHWLKPIFIKGDSLGTLSPMNRTALHLVIPDDIEFEFPVYFGGVSSSSPTQLDPSWIVSTSRKELIFQFNNTLGSSDSIVLSNIPIKALSNDFQTAGFKLKIGLENNLYNRWEDQNLPIEGTYLDVYGMYFGSISATAFINEQSTDELSHIKNSTRMLYIDSLQVNWPEGIGIEQVQVILPPNIEATFQQDSSMILTMDVNSSINEATFSDSIIIGNQGHAEHFPNRGRFPIRLRLYRSNNEGVILTEGIYIKISAPRFYISQADSTPLYDLRLKDRPIDNVTLVIEDDETYRVFGTGGAGDIESIDLDWNTAISWAGEPISEGIEIDDSSDPSLWHMVINPGNSSIFTISGINLIPTTTMMDRRNHPFLRVGDSRIELENSFLVGAPTIQTNDTVISGAYDQLMTFPGIDYFEDDAVSISEDQRSSKLALRIISPSSVVWEATNTSEIVSELPSLAAGDSIMIFPEAKIDHRMAIASSVEQILIEMYLPDLISGVIDTMHWSIEYPDLPAQPHFSEDSLMLPLFSGESLSSAFLININRADTFSVNLVEQADQYDQYNSQMPGYTDDSNITFPRVALIKIDDVAFNWISEQFALGDSIRVAGSIEGSTFRSVRSFSIPINMYPFETTLKTPQPHVFPLWPSGERLMSSSLDSVRWRVFTLKDTLRELDTGISDSLVFPEFVGEDGTIYYVQYSPVDTSKLGFRYTVPVLLDNVVPRIQSRWPRPGDTSIEPGIQPHPIALEEILSTQYFENLLTSPSKDSELIYWQTPDDLSPDTLILINGFDHTEWLLPKIERGYFGDNSSDTLTLSELASFEAFQTALESEYESLQGGNLYTVDSANIVVEYLGDGQHNLGVVTTIIDMAGNLSSDTLVYPVIDGSDGVVYNHFFNYANPFDPRSSEITNYSFLLSSAADDISMVILDGSGSIVQRFSAQDLPAGRHEIKWDGRNIWGEICATGVYFVVLDISEEPQVYTKTLVVNR
jgi:hypothetical protein